ncbi:putative membrane protein [Corynebacterium ulcerans 0102]|nr:putative membrane protein [Corynebacterium ulcerans 0102]
MIAISTITLGMSTVGSSERKLAANVVFSGADAVSDALR